MGLFRKAKEDIKTSLALVLVYGIALRFDWLNPYWAAMAMAMISLQTAGEPGPGKVFFPGRLVAGVDSSVCKNNI